MTLNLPRYYLGSVPKYFIHNSYIVWPTPYYLFDKGPYYSTESPFVHKESEVMHIRYLKLIVKCLEGSRVEIVLFDFFFNYPGSNPLGRLNIRSH